MVKEKAGEIIKHHNWMWKGLILPHSQVRVLPTSEVLSLIESK
jgi:hypothetical protein